MTPPAPASNGSAASAAFDGARFDGTNINPITLLATDYLNHFNEAIMLLEMLPMAPECKEDFLAWTPMSYCEHFAASRFKFRDLAIAAYHVADGAARTELNEITRQMTTILTATREGMERDLSPRTIGSLAEEAARWLKSLVARAGSVINGEQAGAAANVPAKRQDAIDALFSRAVEQAIPA